MENNTETLSDFDENTGENAEVSEEDEGNIPNFESKELLKPMSEGKNHELLGLEKRLDIISQLKSLQGEQTELTWRNSLLHKKLCDYYVKSKRTGGFEKSFIASNIHSDKRYEAVLNEYTVAKTRLIEIRRDHMNELQQLIRNYRILVRDYDALYAKFQSRQLEVIISGENKSKNTQGRVAALLRRQNSLLTDLTPVRISFLKSQNFFIELQHKLDNLNNFGDGYTLMDYENLLMERDALAEKLDQREREIEKIRNKCNLRVRALAQAKNESLAMENQIKKSVEELENLEKFQLSLEIEAVKTGKQKETAKH